MSARYPRPEILSAIPLTHHAVIEASAGTGKTYTIEHLVIEVLLATRATIDQILVLTFTEKATAELKKRIRAMLARILSDAAPSVDGHGWLIDDAARHKLEQALLAFDTASIHTIHGFFQRVLTSNAFPIGRPLVQEMVDGRTAFRRAFRSALRSEIAVEQSLSRHLSAWLEDEERSLDDLEELAFRCLPYHRRGTPFLPPYRPDQLTALLRAGGPAHCPDGAGLKAEVKTLHLNTANAIGRRLAAINQAVSAFRESGDVLALLSALNQTDKDRSGSGSRLELLRARLRELAGESPLITGWSDFLDRLSDLAVSVESAVVQAVLPAVTHQLDTDRAARGQFDFDDMIRLVWEALNGPGAAALEASLRDRYRYALVDEFQDTDDLQWRIFRRLWFAPGLVCWLVGDPKQAIYGFRGADVHAYLEATRAVRALHGQPPVPLDRSFRSTRALLDALNLVFRQDVPAPFFTDPAIQYARPVACGRPDLALTTATGAEAPPVVVLRVPPTGGKLRVDHVRRTLARTIARDIASLLAPDSLHALSIGTASARRRIQASDVFVLTRTGSEGRLVGEALRELAVPHAFYKQDGLFETPEAADVRDLLMAIEAPGDRSRRFRAWLSPFFDVPLVSLPDLAELASHHPLVERLEEWHELALRREYERLFTALADDSGLVRRLLESRHERELTNYLHLFEILLALAQGGARLPDLIVELSAYIAGERLPPGEDAGVQRLESDRAAVQIMTMHKSKGLEADVVYVFGGFSSGPPRTTEPVVYHEKGQRVLHLGRDSAALRARDAEAAHEYQRLLYVALTRARGRVVLPLLPAEELRSMEGSAYALLNRRLADVLAGAPGALFEVRDLPARARPGTRPVRAILEPDALEWPPEPDLKAERVEVEELRRGHRALVMTSYSRIKRRHGGYVSPLDADSFKGETVPADPRLPAVEPDALPGGVAMGILLHEVIEVLPLDTLASAPAVEVWAADPRVSTVLEEKLQQHGVDPGLRPAIERLVHRSLTSPVQLGDVIVPALAGVTSSARELEFTFPHPEIVHPAISAALTDPLAVERGYVQGVIDLVFEHQGRTYFADWKTDILPDYAAPAIATHVERNYRLQAQLYALAMIKLLAIRDRAAYEARFGGLVYCFLRGMRPSPDGASPGVYFERPDFDELVRFDRTLREGGELA